jgi:hypothetical protein
VLPDEVLLGLLARTFTGQWGHKEPGPEWAVSTGGVWLGLRSGGEWIGARLGPGRSSWKPGVRIRTRTWPRASSSPSGTAAGS